MKLTLVFLALLLALSLLLGEVPLGDASGCALLPLTMFLGFAGAAVVLMKRRSVAGAVLILLTALHIAFGPLYYRGAEIESRVVDEADDPVPDARVVATWETNRGRVLARIETRTDRAGFFAIPAWSLRPRAPLDFLDATQPSIEVSAPGFATTVEHDDSPNERMAAVSGEQWRKEIVVYAK